MDFLEPLTRPLWLVMSMPLSIGDVLGFATGLLCVWLTTRASIWNFPTGILNSAILGLVFCSSDCLLMRPYKLCLSC